MRHLVFILLLFFTLSNISNGQTTFKPSNSITPCLGQDTKAWFTTTYSYDSVQWVNNLNQVISKKDTLLITSILTPGTGLYFFDLKLFSGGSPYPSLRLFVVPFKGFNFSINDNTEICEKDTLLIKINNPNNENLKYKWFSNVPSFVPPISTSTQAKVYKKGKYWVKATNLNETCTLVDTMTLAVFNQPVDLGAEKVLCEGEVVTLKNTNSESANTTYLWEYNGKTSTTATLSPTESGVYTLTTTVTPPNCSFSDSVKVTINELPKVKLTPSKTLCKGDTFYIKNTLQNPSLSYTTLWESNTDLPTTSPNQDTLNATKAGTYKLTLNTGSCSASDTTSLKTLDMQVDLDKDILDTCTNGITLFNLKSNTEPKTTYYLWRTPNGNFFKRTITAKETGTYYLTITSDFPQCEVKDSVYIGISSAPTFDLGNDIISENSFVVFDGTFSNRFNESDYSFVWKNPLKDSVYSSKANLILEKEGEHPLTLTITNKTNDCVSSDNFIITIPTITAVSSHVLFIPSAFSPSLAGSENSRMKVLGPDISEDDFRLQIFNRWGDVVYETSDVNLMQNEGWDGQINGSSAQNTTYTYTAVGKFNDGELFKKVGTITLIR